MNVNYELEDKGFSTMITARDEEGYFLLEEEHTNELLFGNPDMGITPAIELVIDHLFAKCLQIYVF